ncbi:MAG: tetratricopeptide repeat protein [Phycisphaerales bacterium]
MLRHWAAGVAALVAVAGLVAPLAAQDAPPPAPSTPNVKTPNLSEAVLKALEAPYLNEEERRDLRVFHGVWREGDLDTPQRRATAALIRGAYDDPALMDEAVAAEDRAEGMLLRGELEECLALLGGADSARALRIRGLALESLGKGDEAAAVVAPLVERLRAQQVTTAPEMVEAVRALMLLARTRPQEQPAGGDFQRMNTLLASARDRLGRLYWPAHVAEGTLHHEKDNGRQGIEALAQALALCPSAAEAWRRIGIMHVEGFNFEAAEKAAEKLDSLAGGPSPGGAVVLARARLRQNDPDGAAAVVEPMLAKFPRMRALLGLQAAVAALRYDFGKTDALLAAYDRLSPGSADAQFEVGRTLSEGRQYEAAERYLAEAAKRAPFRSEPVAELGLLGLQSGKDADAVGVLEKAAALDPFNKRVANTLSLARELQKYARVETDHFIIRHKPGADAVLAREMPGMLETMYRRVTGGDPGGIDHEPAIKTVIDLMPDQRWFAVRIAGITRIHTMAASTGPTIAMEAPREGASHTVGSYDWLRVVRHEFTHTVTLSRTRNRIPHWFTEAAAVYLEDSPRDYRTCRLLEEALENDALHDFSRINLAFVRPRRPTDRQLAYAQGHWMYEYMIGKWGPRAPLDLMDKYAAGVREDAAMREVLGVSQEDFLTEFKAWARGQLAAWGMTPPEGMPTIAAILLSEATDSAESKAGVQSKLDEAAEGVAWSGAAGGGEKRAWELDLPAPDDAMLARWLEKLPEHPDLLEATVKRAVKAAGDTPTDDMAPLLERYAKARPVDPLPHQMLARLHLAKGGGAEGAQRAIPHLEYLDAREQHSSSYAAELARQYAERGEWEKAKAKAVRAVTVAPYSAEYRELAAQVALRAGDFAAAAHQIEALTLLEPDREIHRRRLEAVRKRQNAQ